MLDVNNTPPPAETELRAAMAHFFFAYQAFTAKPDEILARRGLARVHHRVLFFIAREPGLSVKALLARLGVSKQALNIPLRQLIEMNLVNAEPDPADKRMKRLSLSAEGSRLESTLYREQAKLLEGALERAGHQRGVARGGHREVIAPEPDKPFREGFGRGEAKRKTRGHLAQIGDVLRARNCAHGFGVRATRPSMG